MKLKFALPILFVFVAAWPLSGQAADVDPELFNALNSQANHDIQRRKQFKSDRKGKEVFSDEREKGLSQFLEEQEKWDLVRERGLIEHRKQKKIASPVEDGPEHRQDEKVKAQAEQKMEQARKQTVQTRRQVAEKLSPELLSQESDELGLNQKRPRYDLRNRGSNKWVKGGNSRPGSSGSSGGGGGYSAPPPAFDDFPAQPDYMPAPAPMDGFEEIPPPPPPPVNYDGSGVGGFPGIDGGFGDAPPPPPPPLDDFD